MLCAMGVPIFSLKTAAHQAGRLSSPGSEDARKG